MKTIRNDYGIEVRICCASCLYRSTDGRGIRICANGNGIVSGTDSCGEWERRDGLENAGKGGGKIKKQHYIKFFAAERIREEQEDGEKTTVAEKRAKYEKLHGSIYI